MHLLETIQQNLGYPVLQKVDTKTGKVFDIESTTEVDKFGQAAIPSVLAGLYRFSQSDVGASDILEMDENTPWISKIFDENKKEAIQIIASYAKQSAEDPLTKMHNIAKEAIKVMKENVPLNPKVMDVKVFFKEQLNDILLYLLPELKFGDLLNDGTLDDGTNKMEGPISNLMHNIGQIFDSPTTAKDDIK